MAKPPSPPAPDLAELAAEVARLRKRVEALERARPGGVAVVPKPAGTPMTARRNSRLAKITPGLTIEPTEPWQLQPPSLKGRGK